MHKDLFNKVPVNLFRPLSSQRNRLYWHVLNRLYSTLFDEDVESGEYGHAKSTVIDVIESVLDQHGTLWGQDQEGEGSNTDARARANLTYYHLRDSGWLGESKYGYHDYVSMLPRVSQTLAALIEIAEGRALVMTGKLKTLRSGVREVLERPREEADTLIELAKEAGMFSRHLNSIRSSIKELYDRIQGDMPVREVINAFFDDFLREIFIRDYAAVKTTENPLTIRDELIMIIGKLRYNSDIKSELQKGYLAVYAGDDEAGIKELLERDLSRLESVFLNVERQFDAIDQMKVRYEQRVDTVIDYATRTPRTIGRDLKRLAVALIHTDEKSDNDVTVLLPLLMAEGVGEPRFSQVKRPRIPPQPRKVKKRTVSPELLERIRDERAAKKAIQVDEEGLIEFLRVQMGARQTEESHHLVVKNIRDYFCVLNLQRAARLPAMAKQQYPNLMQNYSLNPTDDWEENDYFKMRKVIISRKGLS